MMGFLKAADLFRECWRLYRKYFDREKNSGMWKELVEETEELYEKCGKQLFAKEMIIAVINEIERIDKRV